MKNETNSHIKPVLLVVTSSGVKGKSGIPTGYWLSELTHTLAKLDAAGNLAWRALNGGAVEWDFCRSITTARNRKS